MAGVHPSSITNTPAISVFVYNVFCPSLNSCFIDFLLINDEKVHIITVLFYQKVEYGVTQNCYQDCMRDLFFNPSHEDFCSLRVEFSCDVANFDLLKMPSYYNASSNLIYRALLIHENMPLKYWEWSVLIY